MLSFYLKIDVIGKGEILKWKIGFIYRINIVSGIFFLLLRIGIVIRVGIFYVKV